MPPKPPAPLLLDSSSIGLGGLPLLFITNTENSDLNFESYEKDVREIENTDNVLIVLSDQQ